MKILSIIRLSIDKQLGYGYLKEIVVRRADQKEYVFKEADFPKLHLNDIENMYLMYAQNKFHHLTKDEQTDSATALHFFIQRIILKKRLGDFQHVRSGYLNKNKGKYLMRADELYKFSDGTLKPTRDILNLMLHNFELGYNASMPKRA
uniref:Uncharacterized protein n=1 Tax=Tanacetum cinerariifolium TaxID=118510 RepID=A0A6L2JB06_TANCI|nr:hypothetical protein [Tanacetum cinerariifolium]